MNVLILGGSGGIGGALIAEIASRYSNVNIFATWYRKNPVDTATDLYGDSVARIHWFNSDISSESEVESLCNKIQNELLAMSGDVGIRASSEATTPRLDWIINAVGVLHITNSAPEKSLRQINPEFFMKNIELNALPTLLLAKHFSALIKKSSSPVFATISAKVGSIEDNGLGGWTSYRCSKAALNMALKNISLEWKRSNPSACVVAMHPGTTDTELSLPFQSNVPNGKLFTPQKTASYLVDVVETLSSMQTGKFFSWDGSEIPW